MRSSRSIAISLILIAAFLMVGCSGELQKLSSFSEKAAVGLGESYIIAYAIGDELEITTEKQAEVDQIFIKANTIVLQLNAVIRAIEASDVKTINAAQKQKILDLLSELSKAFDPQKIELIIGIKNADSKASFEAKVELVKTAISGAQIFLASTGGA